MVNGNTINGGRVVVVGGTVGTYCGVTEIAGGAVTTCVGGGVTSGIFSIPEELSKEEPCCKPTHIYTTHEELRDRWWNGQFNNWSTTSTVNDQGLPVTEDVIEQDTVIQVGLGADAKCYKIADNRDPDNEWLQQWGMSTHLQWVKEHPELRPDDAEGLAKGHWVSCTCCKPAGRVKIDGGTPVDIDPNEGLEGREDYTDDYGDGGEVDDSGSDDDDYDDDDHDDDIIRIPHEDPGGQQVDKIPPEDPDIIPIPIPLPWPVDDTTFFFGFTPFYTLTSEFVPSNEPKCILPPESPDQPDDSIAQIPVINIIPEISPIPVKYTPTPLPEEPAPIFYPISAPAAPAIAPPEDICGDE